MDGGYLVKIYADNEVVEEFRCYRVAFDYDMFEYQKNNEKPKKFTRYSKIEIIPEEDKRSI